MSLSMLLPVIRFGYGILLLMLVSKYLAVEQYGQWSLFVSLAGLVITFSSLNLLYAAQLRLPIQTEAEQRRDVADLGVVRLVLTMIVFAGFSVYMLLSDILPWELVRLMGLALLLQSVNTLAFGVLRAQLRIGKQVYLFATESLAILVGVSIARFGFHSSIDGLIYGFVGGEAVSAALACWLLRHSVTFGHIDWPRMRKYLAIGLPLLPFAFSDLIVNALAPMLIKLHDSFESVALYGVAQKAALIAAIPMSIINNVYGPYLSKARLRGGVREVKATFRRFLGLYLLLILPVSVVLILFGQNLISFLSTDEYGGAYSLMLLLIGVNLLISISALIASLFAVFERSVRMGLIWVLVLISWIGLSLWMVPSFGLVGVPYALLAAFGLGLLLAGLDAGRLLRAESGRELSPEKTARPEPLPVE